jgi:hypothetical protein
MMFMTKRDKQNLQALLHWIELLKDLASFLFDTEAIKREAKAPHQGDRVQDTLRKLIAMKSDSPF